MFCKMPRLQTPSPQSTAPMASLLHMSDSLSETARGISAQSCRNHASSSSPFDQEAHLGALLIQQQVHLKHFLCMHIAAWPAGGFITSQILYAAGPTPAHFFVGSNKETAVPGLNIYQYLPALTAKSSFFGRDNVATSRFPEASSCLWICILVLMFTGWSTSRAHQNPMLGHTIFRMKSAKIRVYSQFLGIPKWRESSFSC